MPFRMLVGFLKQLQPVRRLPIWARYALTTLIVLICLSFRLSLNQAISAYPTLFFMPAIIFASLIFDRGSGFYATFLSAALALYFFVEPRTTFAPAHIGEVIALLVFLVTGLTTAGIIEALRKTVDELTDAQKQLSSNLSLLENVIEGAPDPIYAMDREGRFVRVNSMAARAFGVPRDLLIGRRNRDFVPPEIAAEVEHMDEEVIRTGQIATFERPITESGKPPRTYLVTKAPWYGQDGEVLGVVGIARDIHDRKLAEDRLRSSDAHKELLLADINHRVKNHLQSIIGLVSLSRRQITDPQAGDALDDTVRRLGVLARVYDRLQLDGRSTTVSADTFIEGLCTDLKATLLDLRPVAMRVEIERVELGAERAVALGLVVNELVTNALKYAFPDDRTGHILVRFAREGEQFHLEVKDDGVGLAAERRRTGTGQRLVRALSVQLGGSVDWGGPPGTSVLMRFPAEEPRTGAAIPP